MTDENLIVSREYLLASLTFPSPIWFPTKVQAAVASPSLIVHNYSSILLQIITQT